MLLLFLLFSNKYRETNSNRYQPNKTHFRMSSKNQNWTNLGAFWCVWVCFLGAKKIGKKNQKTARPSCLPLGTLILVI
jgi:hypothetical protein